MKAMRGFEQKIDERVDELCEKMRQKSARTGEALDFTEYIRYDP